LVGEPKLNFFFKGVKSMSRVDNDIIMSSCSFIFEGMLMAFFDFTVALLSVSYEKPVGEP